MRKTIAIGFAGLAATAFCAPSLFWLILAGGALAAASLLAFRYNAAASAAWLLVTGCTLEMSLGDLIGPDAYQPIVGLVKAAGLGLAVVAVLRYGPRFDPFNPGFAYAAMFAAGLAHGLHPGLTAAESLRSLAGSAAPFAFSFSRLSRPWTQAVIRMTAWTPAISVAICGVLAAAGVRPLFIELGGMRLAALGHPAFLAGFALAAVYACLIELYRDGERHRLMLLAANLVILVLTGARAPLVYGLVVTALTLVCVSSPVLPARTRLGLVLAAAMTVPVLVAVSSDLTDLRLFNAVGEYADNLSGREELWPSFEAAAAESPWLGWGVGAGNVIIPPTSDVARLMHTWAAHNEYLRMAVEGGQIGRTLLILLFALWCARNSATLPPTDRRIIRLVFVAFACHAFTDNVLISSSASVLFAFVSAVFARGRLEAESASAPV